VENFSNKIMLYIFNLRKNYKFWTALKENGVVADGKTKYDREWLRDISEKVYGARGFFACKSSTVNEFRMCAKVNDSNKMNPTFFDCPEEIVKTASIHFNLLTGPEYTNTPFCVSINDTIHNLPDQKDLLRENSIEVEVLEDSVLTYSYCSCDETIKENFFRYLNVTPGETYNTPYEFFQRPSTNEVNFLPEIWENPYSTRNDDIFDISNVNTFHLVVKNTDQLELMNQFPHNDIKVPFTGDFYSVDHSTSLNEEGWQLSIAGNYSRMFTKQSFKIAYKGEDDTSFEPKKT